MCFPLPFIVFRALEWTSTNDDNQMRLSFPYIAVHAVSKEVSTFPFKPCIFILYAVPDEDDPDQQETKVYRFSTEETGRCEHMAPALFDPFLYHFVVVFSGCNI